MTRFYCYSDSRKHCGKNHLTATIPHALFSIFMELLSDNFCRHCLSTFGGESYSLLYICKICITDNLLLVPTQKYRSAKNLLGRVRSGTKRNAGTICPEFAHNQSNNHWFGPVL